MNRLKGNFFISEGTEFQILTPWNLIFLCNVSVLYLGKYKLYWDDAKRVDRVCTEAIEVKKEEKLGGKFFLVYLYINLATS